MKVIYVLRAVACLQAIGVCLQPVLAGVYLNSSPTGVRLHEPAGLALTFLGLAQLLLATIWWRSGGHRTAVAVSVLLLAGEAGEVAMGYTRQLAIHVPLGVALVAGTVGFAYWITRRSIA